MNKTVSKPIRSSWSCKNCSLPEDVYVRNRFLEASSWSESLRNRLFRTETVLVGLTPPTFHRKGDWRLEIRLGIWRKVQWGCSAQISTFGTIESRTFSSWVFYDSQRAHPFSYVALPVRNKLSLLRAVTTINSSTFPLAGARSMFKCSELVGELPSSAKRKKIRHSKLRHAFSTNW